MRAVGKPSRREIFNLSTLVREVSDQFDIENSVEANVSIDGQKEFIRRALINLVENAQKYGAPPYRITLSQSPTHALVEVLDLGNGFDTSETEEMLRSFKRGKNVKHISGSGLGLTIVDRVAAAHDGTITFSKHAVSGFRAELRLSR